MQIRAEAKSINAGTVAARNSEPNKGPIQKGSDAPSAAQPTKATKSVSRAVSVI
jgi:hypothetical protein